MNMAINMKLSKIAYIEKRRKKPLVATKGFLSTLEGSGIKLC
jgi:hypothetical protein